MRSKTAGPKACACGCGQPADAHKRGYASACYQRARIHGEITVSPRRCRSAECDGPYYAKGLCHRHYRQARYRARAEARWTGSLSE